jgi:L-lactate dehydrogenase
VLDTSRLRILLAERLGVAVANVHATIVGEHGDSEIALWSSATVGGVALRDFAARGRDPLSVVELQSLLHDVRTAAYRIIEGKGATTFAIGLATARILAAIRNDEHAVLPVSAPHHFDGIGEVCLSLPRVVGRAGVLATLPVALDDDERAGLLASARTIAATFDALG